MKKFALKNARQYVLQGVSLYGSYSISGGRLRNKSLLKKSIIHKSSPSHNFFIVTALTSLRSGCNMLYTVEGVTPASRASSVYDISRSAHNCLKRSVIASFIVGPHRLSDNFNISIASYTRQRIRTCVLSAFLLNLF